MQPNRRLVLLFLLLATGVIQAGGRRDDNLSAGSQAEADVRAGRIKEELAHLKGHEWPGEYYRGDGLGVNVSLVIAPGAGFVFRWSGCLGLYDLNYGGIAVTGGRIKLSFEHPNRPDGAMGIDPELIPVLWGERHYLVGSAEMKEFANAVNSGIEPRNGLHGLFLLRRGDEKKAATGDPLIPAEYRGLLLTVPITARISRIGESQLAKAEWCPSGQFRTTPVTLDAGTEKGVQEGMEFYVAHSRRYVSPLHVIKVEARSSETKVVQCTGDPPPSTDWELVIPSRSSEKR
jgi:hypothetical protein